MDSLLARAFLCGPAEQANLLIDTVRGRMSAEVGAAVNYEVALLDPSTGAERGWPYLERHVAPRLAFFLRSKKLRVSCCAPVFLTVFYRSEIFFVRAADFFDEVRQHLGLEPESFAALTNAWEQTGQGAVGALPG